MIFRTFLVAMLWFSTNIFAAPNIVVSIKPIHSIVSSLTQGITEPKLLLKANQSAHHAHLKPSQLSLLNQADLAIFIHPDFEEGLKKVLANLDVGKTLIIGNMKKISLIHNQHQKAINYHLWLDINNMQIFAKKLIEKLIEIDPDNRSKYTTNLNNFNKNSNTLKQTIGQKLSAYKSKTLASYADTFDYYTHANQLKKSVNITNYHDEKLSIFKMIKAKKTMKNTQTKCLLATTEVSKKRLHSLTEGLTINSTNIDIMGFDVAQGSEHYFKLMHNITNKVTQCFK
ncbi:ABC transporter substrate-binding protein [Bathymodiolus thermophilus thioautotrophic gill symbiont]|uniref:High-affinity zinc uptake system protein ZnuA n=1 Tax=Bathymodiolus thermophilus thioautotrophic gill symbiont TaxID=2360 RepID=A0A3G3IK72_9GAMM|nr:zinc ABC transporter substrate-binding protein [Bathymodiolus thermophilus thioautotrophic gill symbiont]AYQ56129.1 ABC transporter substrate-binding protein [Bathymodiolus thermophilus thioautotrophic gill symbiont]